MKRKSLVLLSVLLVLCIVPSIFIPSSNHAVIPVGSSVTKDFSLSAEWFSEDWTRRKQITITGSSGAGTNYQVAVTVVYDSDMQADFDDIRFTDGDGVTELDYWRETYTASTTASFWVNVTDNIDTNQIIFMYYGNAGVSTTSSGEDTFIFFDDFENNNLDRWTTAEAQWSTQGTYKKYGSYAAYGDSAATGRNLEKQLSAQLEYGIMFHGWFRFLSVAGTEYPLVAYENDTTLIYICHSPANEFSTYNGSSTLDYFTNGQTATTWIEIEIGLDWVSDEFVPFFDGVEKTHHLMDSSTGEPVTDVQKIGSVLSSSANYDHWLDDYYVRKWISTEPSVSIGSESYNWHMLPEAQLFFDMPDWHLIITVIIRFVTPIDITTVNWLLIFFGMCLIPTSTVYLVYGGRKSFSTDKLFYGLIAFVMGWALLLGGIM